MKARGILAVAAVVILAAVGAWFAWRPTPPPAASVTATGQAAADSATIGVVSPSTSNGSSASNGRNGSAPGATVRSSYGGSTPTAAANVAPPLRQPSVTQSVPENAVALVELDQVHHMITDYHTLMGENPVGTNSEIMKALMGGNPHQAMLGPAEGKGLNGQGELVDHWGTPYFFHQLSRDHMEIHSAGPDKVFGTADDLVVQ